MSSNRDSDDPEKKRRLLADIVTNLNANKADYIIIGGFAVNHYDKEREPNDLDIWISPRGDNPDRVADALIQARFNTLEVTWGQFKFSQPGYGAHLFHPETGIKLDILTDVSGSEYFGGFANASKNAVSETVDGIEYKFLNLKHLTINKIASWGEDREKDIDDARSLLAIDRELTREHAELEAFKREVDGLCDRIFGPEMEREPEAVEKSQRAAPEPEKQPEATQTQEQKQGKEHEPEVSEETNSKDRHESPSHDRPGVAGASESGMSRYLLCLPCREFVQDENEPDKVVKGYVKLAEARCDRCSDPLPIGTKAAAASFFDSPEHYRSWEHERLAIDEPPQKSVRMSLQGYDPANLDDACHFVGVFVRKAIEQGWTKEEATETAKQVTAKRAFEDLRQHIEPTPAEPVTWRTQLDRIRDYTRGLRLLNDDPNVKPNPVGWWLRGLSLARQGQSEGLDQAESPKQERPSRQESDPKSLQKVARALDGQIAVSETEQQPERAEKAPRPSPKLEKRTEATPTRDRDRDRGHEPEW